MYACVCACVYQYACVCQTSFSTNQWQCRQCRCRKSEHTPVLAHHCPRIPWQRHGCTERSYPYTQPTTQGMNGNRDVPPQSSLCKNYKTENQYIKLYLT